jgi:hypothetical protein
VWGDCSACQRTVDFFGLSIHSRGVEVDVRVSKWRGEPSLLEIFDGTANIYSVQDGDLDNKSDELGKYHVYVDGFDVYVLHDIDEADLYRLATNLTIESAGGLGSVGAWQNRLAYTMGKKGGRYAFCIEKQLFGKKSDVFGMIINHPQPAYSTVKFEVRVPGNSNPVGGVVRSFKTGTSEVVEQWVLAPAVFEAGWSKVYLKRVNGFSDTSGQDPNWRYIKESLDFVLRPK